MKRGDKIFLDKNNSIESRVNMFLECRDGIVEMFEYRDCSGYGSTTRLFYCRDTKHEVASIIRQVYVDYDKKWLEEVMAFDSDSFEFLAGLINGNTDVIGGKHSVLRDYSNDQI